MNSVLHVINARNVNDAFWHGCDLLRNAPTENTRAGPARVFPAPVVTVLAQPTARVLLEPTRDANPFFHLFESLWMLAGRNDARWLDRFVKDFSSRFAEEDGTLHGAYGYRWRQHFGFDQLNEVVGILQKFPGDRRVVIQMWDCTPDGSVLGEANDLSNDWKDVPCNTHIYPRIVDDALDFTVCCRSNDLVWGLCGANAVHMSMLMEYMAGRIGVRVGRMITLSNNLHAYVDVFDKQKPVMGNPYEKSVLSLEPIVEPMPIGENWAAWDEDLRLFMNWADDGIAMPVGEYPEPPDFVNSWFANTAYPMWMAHHFYRTRVTMMYPEGRRVENMEPALECAREILASDWRRACVEWLERRRK